MAERNPRIPHSIESLLFVNRNGKYCGYKLELIIDNISADLREFLICAECKGISRKPRNWEGNTVCAMCVTGQSIENIDKRVENKVAFLNARCPLSGEGCSWEGKLREIEQHMEECMKVRVECQLECGNVLERESIEQHNREVCPLRIIQCIYCNQEIQANEENPHIGQCRNHPDTEVPCPYKELGCEAIVLRKNSNTHITENITNHQELMLYQLNQLRNRNDQLERANQQQRDKNEEVEKVNEQQRDKNEELERVNEQQRDKNQQLERVNQELRDRITTIETSATNRERKLTKERKNARKRWRVWVILALVAVGIGVILAAIIGIAVAASQGNNIKANSNQTESNSEQIKSNSNQTEYNSIQIKSNSNQTESNSIQIKSNSNQTESNSIQIKSILQQTESNSIQIKSILQQTEFNSIQIKSNSNQTESNSNKIESNSQQLESLLFSLGYIYKYIEERGKVLPGIERIYNLNENETFYGPTFYLKQCKLRLKTIVIVKTYLLTGHLVERLEGEYDGPISNCRITYSYTTFWYLDATQPETGYPNYSNINLEVGDSVLISLNYWDGTEGKGIVRAYFDTTGD